MMRVVLIIAVAITLCFSAAVFAGLVQAQSTPAFGSSYPDYSGPGPTPSPGYYGSGTAPSPSVTSPEQSLPPSGTITVCSEDVAPPGMVVTWTGNANVCRGPCRARALQRVIGPIMVICAHQPVPKDYTIDSVTTTPNCSCLGDEDNAYVIRKVKHLGNIQPQD
jgi:hypothetical protein